MTASIQSWSLLLLTLLRIIQDKPTLEKALNPHPNQVS